MNAPNQTPSLALGIDPAALNLPPSFQTMLDANAKLVLDRLQAVKTRLAEIDQRDVLGDEEHRHFLANSYPIPDDTGVGAMREDGPLQGGLTTSAVAEIRQRAVKAKLDLTYCRIDLDGKRILRDVTREVAELEAEEEALEEALREFIAEFQQWRDATVRMYSTPAEQVDPADLGYLQRDDVEAFALAKELGATVSQIRQRLNSGDEAAVAQLTGLRGRSARFRELVAELSGYAGRSSQPPWIEARPGFPKHLRERIEVHRQRAGARSVDLGV